MVSGPHTLAVIYLNEKNIVSDFNFMHEYVSLFGSFGFYLQARKLFVCLLPQGNIAQLDHYCSGNIMPSVQMCSNV